MAVGPASLARPAPVAGRPFTLRGFVEREGVFSWLMLAPGVVFLLAFVAYPFFYGIYLSLQDRRVSEPGTFVGLANFAALFQDGAFWQVTRNTFVYTIVATFLKMIGGLAMALVMNQRFRGRNLARAFLLLPFIVPTILSTVAWMWILDPTFSVINWTLLNTGLVKTNFSWLGNATLAMVSIIAVNVWRGAPFYRITPPAGVQTLSPHLYAAAALDRARTHPRLFPTPLPPTQPEPPAADPGSPAPQRPPAHPAPLLRPPHREALPPRDRQPHAGGGGDHGGTGPDGDHVGVSPPPPALSRRRRHRHRRGGDVSGAAAAPLHPHGRHHQPARPGQYAQRGDADLPHPPHPLLRVAPHGLLQERAPRARGSRAHRRGQPLPGHGAGGAAAVRARAAVRRHLRLHPGPDRVPLRAHLPRQERGADGAGGRHHRADPGRRLLLGPAHGGRAAGLGAGGADLLVLRGVLRGGPHRGLGEELARPHFPMSNAGSQA